MGARSNRARPRLVVGVDGSPVGQRALDWAVDYAATVNGEVIAVTVCPLTMVPAVPLPMAVPIRQPVPAEPDLEPHRELLRAAAEQARQRAPDVPVSQVVETGAPGFMLCAHAKQAGADLLVVGSHGRGPVLRALLGSVSSFCIQHAPCPVMVIPAALATAEAAASSAAQGRW